MAAPVSDEEYGRAWCRLVGKVPGFPVDRHAHDGAVYWWTGEQFLSGQPEQQLPRMVYTLLFGDTEHERRRWYADTEAEAYAAVGLAVRRIHAAVPAAPVLA